MDRMKCLLQVVDDDAKPLGTAGRIMPPRRILALLSIAGAALALALSAESGTSNPGPPLPELTVSLDARHPGRAVTPRYLGLSFELSSAGVLASLADRGDLVGLLRSLGPGVLRLGGASADTRVAWTDSRTPVPSWASAVLDRHVLRGIARLAARSNWRVLLTLGLVHFDPRAAAREVAAARSIYTRLLAYFDGRPPTPQRLLEADPEEMRAAAGLSRAKVGFLRSLAEHVLRGELELDHLDELSDERVIEELTAVKGIGEWSAHMFLMFHLQRPDVMAVGDLGIRRAVERAYGLDGLPDPKQLLELSEAWRPHRTLACRYLWRSLANEPT